MKPEDFAQVLELAEWEERQERAILPEPTLPSATHCRNAECGDEIPEARREVYPGVQLCVKCKAKEEQPIRGRYANAN